VGGGEDLKATPCFKIILVGYAQFQNFGKLFFRGDGELSFFCTNKKSILRLK